ncbi:hypothetical protein [Leptolyngbya sp. KIOST-1]|uniref:hypothetical protein n=1 Tax=Leptolyngbya sp. KIOST-1 TaxID=1229172 RepID=UPI00055E78D5|nr:hypothetical protein [Leptolyngbya sp. KIOST-1]
MHNTVFEGNSATAGAGANPGMGKGGAIFVPDAETLQAAYSQAGGDRGLHLLPQARALGRLPTFIDNYATDAAASATDNPDWYGVISHSAGVN